MGNTSGSGSSSAVTSSTPSVSGSSVGSIQRVNDQTLDRQFTAKDLIGKEVYDNRDKRIGEIKDVVLDSTQFSQLASAIGSRVAQTGTYGGGSDSTASNGTSSSDRNSSRLSSDSPKSVANTGASADATSVRQGSDFASMSSEPAAIISHGGLLGVGNDLLSVPLSQLNFDQNKHHLTLNVSEQQLSSLQSPSDRARSATE
jgi:hypothetical protein